MKLSLTLSILLLFAGGCANLNTIPIEEERQFIRTLEQEGWKIPPSLYSHPLFFTRIYASDKAYRGRIYGVKVDHNNLKIQIKTHGNIHFEEKIFKRNAKVEFCEYMYRATKDKAYYNCAPYMFHHNKLTLLFSALCKSNFGGTVKTIDSKSIALSSNAGDIGTIDSNSIKRLRTLYKYPSVINATCISEKDILALENQKKITKCKEYGFEESTEGMSLCLMQLDKIALEEENKHELLSEINNQREAQALINASRLLLEGKKPTSSLGVFRGSELSGHNKICYYDDATGSRKAITVGAADQCPR